jgi:hypothetical protein
MNLKWSIALICLVLVLSLAHTTVSSQIPVDDVEVRLDDLGYSDISLNGLYGMASIWIPLQNRWEIDSPVTVDVVYTGSPLLNPESAVLTVKVNGQAVSSIRPVGDGAPKTFRVTVPPSLVQQPGFQLEFTGFLKITDLECEDTNNPGQWLIVQNSTTLRMSPQVTGEAPGLDHLLDALVIRSYDDNPTPIIFAIPDTDDTALLTAAGRIAAHLGTATTADHLPFTIKTFNALTLRDKRSAHIVVVGLLEDVPFWEEWAEDTDIILPAEDAFETPGGRVLPPESALIQLFVSPWNPANNILLLSATGIEGIEMGGNAFAHRQTRQTFTGPYAVVDDLVTLPAPQPGLRWSSTHTTFQQLGELDQRVTGIGNQDAFYFFRIPPGWVFSPGAQLTLHMAFSPALRDDESYAIIYINDVYVGTVSVAPDADDVWVAMELPTRTLNERARTGRPMNLDLRLAIANLLPVDSCDQINLESSWTVIYRDSYFTIEHDYAELPDLHAFPYPFVTAISTPPISVVLPQNHTLNDLQYALALTATLGKYALPDIDIDIITADAASQESLEGHNLIILGEMSRQPLIEALVSEDDLLRINRQLVQLDEPNIGILHSLISAWSPERNVLLVYGETQSGFAQAAEALYTAAPPVFEPGSVAFIRAGRPPLMFQRDVEPAVDEVVVAELIITDTSPTLAVEDLPTIVPSPEAPQETAALDLPQIPLSETVSAGNGNNISETERLVLIITAFLIILITLALLGRILFRLVR